MQISDLNKFKFDDEKHCVAFHMSFKDNDIIFIRQKDMEANRASSDVTAIGQIWRIIVVEKDVNEIPNILFGTVDSNPTLALVAETGLYQLAISLREKQGTYDEICRIINEKIRV